MPTRSSHDIATRYGGSLALAVGRVLPDFQVKGHAYVIDLKERKQICDFPVRHDGLAGGEMLALSQHDDMCFVGCYEAYGIAAYSIPEGKEIWRRKDLKRVRTVRAFFRDDLVFCGRADGAAHVLNGKTGATVEKLIGVRDIYSSFFDDSAVVAGRSIELHRPFGVKKAKLSRTNNKYLTAVFSKTELLIDEVGHLRCFDLESLELLWEYNAKYSRFEVLRDNGCFLAGRFDGKGVDFIGARSGKIVRTVELLFSATSHFCLDGKAIFGGDLRLYSTETDSFLHDFTKNP